MRYPRPISSAAGWPRRLACAALVVPALVAACAPQLRGPAGAPAAVASAHTPAAAADALAPMAAISVRCHGDLHPEDVFYRPDRTVLIDREETHACDPLFELAVFADQIDLAPTDFGAYFAAYGPIHDGDVLRSARHLAQTLWHRASGAAQRLQKPDPRLTALLPSAGLAEKPPARD